jgi:C-terminal processing protease CtpA/Prc
LSSFGFGYGLEGNGLFIWFVYTNSPAGRAGLRAGMQIMEINDRDISDLNLDEYCNIRNEKLESDVLFLKVKEGENLREVELNKEFLHK